MNSIKCTLVALALLLPLVATSAPVDLTHPSSQPRSELEHQPYDLMEYYIKGTGYISVYGETDAQEFSHPRFADGDHVTPIASFFARQLGFDPEIFVDGSAHFQKEGVDHYLKLKTFATSYSYTLLKVAPYRQVITLPTDLHYVLKPGQDPFPHHELIPSATGFHITKARYFDYEEIDFSYARGRHSHQGKNWKIDFEMIARGDESFRYITAHDYKARMLQMGGTLLEDEDNSFVFRVGNSIAAFKSYNHTFSLNIVEEQAFEQSLVLTPDTIKTELDRAGKITLDGIYFDFNEATLKPESRKAILSTVALMEGYPDLVLAVHGHTDDKGSEDYNLKLSGDRAASVTAAISAEGIEAARLQSKGFGETAPIAPNATDEGRAENRRVELHKISGGETKTPITIDFIKPMANSIVASRYSHPGSSLSIQYAPPYSEKKERVEYAGHLDVLSYEIQKDGQTNTSISRTEITKNYENILELYDARILDISSSNISFHIPDRGDGLSVFGRIEAYDGKYTIRFLVED
jgi:outer membrane protein OmpA-like peptidoglycan-associated protein|nr:OmpA family protein [Candidatus Krumholzibacteria bacterium]